MGYILELLIHSARVTLTTNIILPILLRKAIRPVAFALHHIFLPITHSKRKNFPPMIDCHLQHSALLTGNAIRNHDKRLFLAEVPVHLLFGFIY